MPSYAPPFWDPQSPIITVLYGTFISDRSKDNEDSIDQNTWAVNLSRFSIF